MPSQYGSKLNTFYGFDLYNLVWPVLPPADLPLATTAFIPQWLYNRTGASTRVVGFNVKDKPLLRSLGMWSNFADGLVDNISNHDYANGLALRLQLERWTAVRTGTLTTASGSANVTGAGTLFTTEAIAGSTLGWIDDAGIMRTGVVNTPSSATALSLNSVALSNATAVSYYRKNGNAGSSLDIPFGQLNVNYDLTFFLGDVSTVDETVDGHLRIYVTVPHAWAFNTVSVNPSHATKRLQFYPVAVIEHNFDLSQAI